MNKSLSNLCGIITINVWKNKYNVMVGGNLNLGSQSVCWTSEETTEISSWTCILGVNSLNMETKEGVLSLASHA